MALHRWIGASLMSSVLAIGCKSEPARAEPQHTAADPRPRKDQAADATPPLPVAVAGCHALGTKPICLRRVDPDTGKPPHEPLHLWLEGSWDPGELSLRYEGRPLDFEPIRDVDGVWIELPELAPGQLVLTHTGYRPFELELASLSSAYSSAFKAAAKASTIEEAEAEIARARPQLNPRERFLLDCLLVRKHPPSLQSISKVLQRLQTLAKQFDEVQCLSRVATQAVDSAGKAGATEQAARLLEVVRTRADLDLVARINGEYYSALAVKRLGLLGEALHGHARAARLASRIGRHDYEGAALIEQALVLARIGRFEEAGRLASEALAHAVESRIYNDIRFQAAWLAVLQREHDSKIADPSGELRELVAAYEAKTSRDARKAAIARLNLAVARLQSGDHDEAAAELARIERSQLDGRQQLYFELTGSRLDLEQGRLANARAKLEHAELLAELTHDREFVLELLDNRATLEQRAGRTDAALDAFARAEVLADELARQIPANVGRSSYWTTLTGSRARHIELALAAGQLERALCTVLGARARHLRALGAGLELFADDPERRRVYVELLERHREARASLELRLREAWKLSSRELEQQAVDEARARRELDELLERAMHTLERNAPAWDCTAARPSGTDEALLTAYPSADGHGWLFLLDRVGRIVHRYAEGSARAAAETALVELASELDGVSELSVVALGELLTVDLRELEPLADASAPRVRYSLGLGSSSSARRSELATVVAGVGNLVEVEAEVREVGERLAARGWSFDPTWDPSARAQPRLLHYAGHAYRSGLGGWDSHLLLDDGPLKAESLLLEQRAPDLVILSACDAGAGDGIMLDGGMNIAVAFLLAGARVVVAADGEVNDSLARAFAGALHAALPSRDAIDPDAVVAALAKLRRDDSRFAAWRAWVP